MEDIARRVLDGDGRALSRALSLLEQNSPEAPGVMKSIDLHTGRCYTVGITGPPGAGKSTIVNRLTELLRARGLTVGVIGVDPTSPFSGGALLGDRIRMQRHYLDQGVFIRSVATRGQAGGVPRLVKSMVRLLDAAGKDVVLVETVGVGQTELGIMGVADTVLVVLMPESGDAVQALKAGIMEIADIYLVNKADREGSGQMAAAITAMLQTSISQPDWDPPVLMSTAHTGNGIEELWMAVQRHREFSEANSLLTSRRERRRENEFLEAVEEEIRRRIKVGIDQSQEVKATLREVAAKELEPYSAAIHFLDSGLDFKAPWNQSSLSDHGCR